MIKLNIKKVEKLHNLADSSWENKKYGFAGGDEIESWKSALLRFGDQMPAICYSFGISHELLKKEFPKIYSVKQHYDNLKGKEWPCYEDLIKQNISKISPKIVEEIFDIEKWDDLKIAKNFDEGHFNQYTTEYSIFDQINFVETHKTRIPNKVLDIGGGRGEIANCLQYMGIDCVSIEPGLESDFLYNETSKLFFGKNYFATPTKKSFQKYTYGVDYSQFDTIILCQSIEHLPEKQFWNFWEIIKRQFTGLIIIVNWLYYHPIPISLPEHIFEINDNVYNKLINESKKCVYKNYSHLILEM